MTVPWTGGATADKAKEQAADVRGDRPDDGAQRAGHAGTPRSEGPRGHGDGGYAAFYERVCAPWRSPARARLLRGADKALVWAIAVAYAAAAVRLVVTGDTRVVRFLAVPAVSFVLVSVVRRVVDEPRPSVRDGVEPVLDVGKTGESMPSRHVFSACVIGCALGWLSPAAGACVWAAAVALAYARVAGGAHYPRDVIVAAVAAVACAAVGFLV